MYGKVIHLLYGQKWHFSLLMGMFLFFFFTRTIFARIMHAVLQRTKKGSVIETAEDEIEFQRGVNDGHYAIVMGTATFVFWSTLIPGLLVQDDPHKVVPFGNAIKTVAFFFISSYVLS